MRLCWVFKFYEWEFQSDDVIFFTIAVTRWFPIGRTRGQSRGQPDWYHRPRPRKQNGRHLGTDQTCDIKYTI